MYFSAGLLIGVVCNFIFFGMYLIHAQMLQAHMMVVQSRVKMLFLSFSIACLLAGFHKKADALSFFRIENCRLCE